MATVVTPSRKPQFWAEIDRLNQEAARAEKKKAKAEPPAIEQRKQANAKEIKRAAPPSAQPVVARVLKKAAKKKGKSK